MIFLQQLSEIKRSYRHSARIVSRLRRQAKADKIRVTIHGHREMAAENITYDSVREALINGEIIENYVAKVDHAHRERRS
uniref:Uncharacterized protein n=1 Tax=Candidatus Kentrum sp. FW TaxID=2126338 RepID=A0A450T5T2_9GAMM|nr:MAG: hypothetical protein BECKFW1821A_GA0114235_11227 [Candidatus Kentron sp. FW]